MTGLSGSGKSTLAKGLQDRFERCKINSFILDGDVLRSGLNSDLDFTRNARRENVRRVTEISKLFSDAGIIPIVALISPYLEDRTNVRIALRDYGYMEVYIKCPIHVCERRDPKGLYKKARNGSISNFTGISDVFDPPLDPEIVLDTEHSTYIDCLNDLWYFLDCPQMDTYCSNPDNIKQP
jgi:adenylylsulfate kinase